MLKKRQKWIALPLALAFAWMAQFSAMPLAAAGASAATAAASAEQAPNYVEVPGHGASPAKSKSILPIVLIGAGVVAVAAVLFLVVLKTKYDILGNWMVTWNFTSGYAASGTVPCVFTGTKESGTVSGFYGDSGPYSVDGKNVTWTLSSYDPTFKWTGRFDTKDTMSGTLEMPSEGVKGTWTAVRAAATTHAPLPAAAQAVRKNWSTAD